MLVAHRGLLARDALAHGVTSRDGRVTRDGTGTRRLADLLSGCVAQRSIRRATNGATTGRRAVERAGAVTGSASSADRLGCVQPDHRPRPTPARYPRRACAATRPTMTANADRHGPRGRLGEQRARPAAAVDAGDRRDDRGGRRDRRRRAARPPRRRRSGRATRCRARSSGQNDDAATANASPTTSATAIERGASSDSTNGTTTASPAATRKSRTEPRSTSCDSTPATDTVSPDDVDRNAANAPAVTSAVSSSPPVPADEPFGQQQHRRVGAPGQQQVRRVEPASAPYTVGQQVEGAEQAQHDQRRAAGGPAVGVGVEAHQHVRQPHRAEERARGPASTSRRAGGPGPRRRTAAAPTSLPSLASRELARAAPSPRPGR